MNAPKAGSTSTGLSSASSPARRSARNDRRHPVPRPNALRKARSEAPASLIPRRAATSHPP